MKIIFHIDLNAFYASAEVLRHPEYIGKPLVVAGNSKRGIITTASYEARKYGIHSAMPLFKAKELCKNLIIVPPDFTYYREISNKFFAIIATYSTALEVASIDECYVDMSNAIKDYTKIIEVANQIQATVKDSLGISCSIGISPNKFLSKMASDLKKPNGITMITKKNIATTLWVLPIGKMHGIGKKTAPKFIAMGIETIGDLAKYENYDIACSILGKNALLFYYRANGVDPSNLNVDHNKLKSVGHSITLLEDTSDEEEIKEYIKDLSLRVSQRANNKNLLSKNISITLKYSRFESVVRSISIEQFTNEYEIILSNAIALFDKHFENRSIRLIGVSLNNTIERSEIKKQLSIFNYLENNKDETFDDLINSLHHVVGKEH